MQTLLRNLQNNSLRLFKDQQRLASGQNLLSIADDPIAAEKITRMVRSLESQTQISTNLRHADAYLSAADSAVSEIGDLLNQATTIAIAQAGNLQSAEERQAQAAVIDGLIEQLAAIGNRRYEGGYLFGGRDVNTAPLSTSLGRVANTGDRGDRFTIVSEDAMAAYSINVSEIFEVSGTTAGGYADFNVQLSGSGRISELGGANGQGVRLGRIHVAQTGPAMSFEVDFTGAETINDLIERFNDAASTAGSALSLGINPSDGSGPRVTTAPGVGVTISDVNNGTTAADLGIAKTVSAGLDLDGDAVNRRITQTTLISDLQPSGLSLTSGIVITTGQNSATVDFAGATTVQDVLNRINGTGLGVNARINSTGDGIEIENLVGGVPLVIGENGGLDAEALGIRTLSENSSVYRLNNNSGIHPITGDDFQITDPNGISFAVDISNAQTVGDVINAINAAATLAGSNVTAAVSTNGAGLQLTSPGGPNPITVSALNLSPVAEELGILKTGSATLLDGDAVAPFVQEGIFSSLYRLRDGLMADNSREITEAGEYLQEAQQRVASIAGQVGALSKSMRARSDQTQDAVDATTVLLSQLRDVDLTEAVTRFQQAQSALQATLLTGSATQNLSLLDFLR
jgi:flagellin-like hook-associated protein FlgL